MASITNLPVIEQIVLERIRERIQSRGGRSLLDSLRYFERRDNYFDVLIRELEWRWFGIHRNVTEETKHPKDWWNAVKERFFPKWLLKKYPVEYTKVLTKIEVTKVCPHLNLATDGDNYAHIAWIGSDKFLESDWKTDKRVPDWLRKTVHLLELSAYYIDRESPMLAGELRTQAKQLKEEIL